MRFYHFSKSKLLSPAALLVILPLILFYQVCFSRSCLLPANLLKDVYPWRTGNPKDLVPWNVLQFDGITQFYPWRLFAAQTWRAGLVPLWNPHQFCGTPFLANGQSAVLYLPNLLFVLMPVKFAFGWSAVLHLIFTGVTAYLFFRRAGGSSPMAAAIGAACWQLSTWQISWLSLPTFLDTSAWLPSALLAGFYLVKRPSVFRASALAVIISMMVLAGHLQISFYCIGLTAAYCIYRLIVEKSSTAAALKAAVVVTTLAILLAAAQVLPTLELSKLSARGGATASASGYASYVSSAMPLEQAAGLFIPGFFGHPEQGTYLPQLSPYPENACYIGVFALLLALIALSGIKQGRERLFFAGAGLFALLIALGSPLNMLFYYRIPGFASTGSPARILVLLTFAAAFLAAQGVDDVLSRHRNIWWGAGAYIAAAALVVGWTLAQLMHGDGNYLSFVQNDLRLFAGLAIGCLAVMALYQRKTLNTRWTGACIFALLSIDLLFVNFGYNPAARPEDVYPLTPSILWLKQHAGTSRIMPLNTHWSNIEPPNAVLPPNSATVYGLYDMQGYDSLQTRSYREYANKIDGTGDIPPENGNITFTFVPGSPQVRAAAAKYLVSLVPLEGFGDPVISDGQTLVYADSDAQPLADQLANVSATEMKLYASKPFDLAVQHYPGWQARDADNGVAVGISADESTTSGPFMHVNAARPGYIELHYVPSSFQVGLYLSLLGIALLAVIGTLKLICFPKAVHPRSATS